jgi:hypothetical protein
VCEQTNRINECFHKAVLNDQQKLQMLSALGAFQIMFRSRVMGK